MQRPSLLRTHPRLFLCAALGLLLYVICGFTPSHYGYAARLLGLPDAGPILGVAWPERSDEWSVLTPYFQIAVANNLGPINEASPFRETLKGFYALPSRDWSMVFKPDLWGFLLLDPAHAFSLHYAVLSAAMVAGFTLLLWQLGCSSGVALASALTLFASQFVQVWWSSNAATLAWAAWPAVIFLWRGPPLIRLPLLAYAVATWLIGELYPPFIISGVLALAAAIASFRPDRLQLSNLAPGILAAGAGGVIAWLHYSDLIPIMLATSYPGRRVSDGGGLEPLQLAAHIFPYSVTNNFQPLGLWESNPCDVAAVGSFLPLALVTFADHTALAAWVRRNRRQLLIWLACLAALTAWSIAPIPGAWAPILNRVPGHRMVWGLGLLLLLGVAVIASHVPWRLSARRVAAFCAAVLAGWAISKLMLSQKPISGVFDVFIVGALLQLLLLRRLWPDLLPARRLILIAIVLTQVATFGLYNPVQPAGPIFAPQRSAFLDSLRAYARSNPHGVAVVPGGIGAVLNGAGVPSINHALMRPELEFFRTAYPELAPNAFNEFFNRYEHLWIRPQWEPSLLQSDVAIVTPDPFATPLKVVVTAGSLPPARFETFDVTPLGDRRWGVIATGKTGWRGVTSAQLLRISLASDSAQIETASAYRLPSPSAASVNPAEFAARYGVRMTVLADRAPTASNFQLEAKGP